MCCPCKKRITFMLVITMSALVSSFTRTITRRTLLWPKIRSSSALFSTKRIVFLGTPDVAATTLQTLIDASKAENANFEIVSVVTQPAKRRKRKGNPEPSPVGYAAEAALAEYTKSVNDNPASSIDPDTFILTPDSAKDVDFLDTLEYKIKPDLCITAAYGQYLPKRFLQIPKYGTVNIHPSLLPRWRGASPVQRSLQAGDNPVGVSLLYTVSKMDAGPIVAQASVTINDDTDTAANVLPMLFEVGTKLLLDKMDALLDGTITMDNATPQNDNEAVPAPLIDPTEGELKPWCESARTMHNKLRAFCTWPGVYMFIQVGDDVMKLKVLESRVLQDTVADPTRALVVGPDKQSGMYVTSHDGSVLELLQVQPATRKAFRARDLQNGYPNQVISWIETPTEFQANPEKYNSRKVESQ